MFLWFLVTCTVAPAPRDLFGEATGLQPRDNMKVLPSSI
jgi:hypothetical protein